MDKWRDPVRATLELDSRYKNYRSLPSSGPDLMIGRLLQIENLGPGESAYLIVRLGMGSELQHQLKVQFPQQGYSDSKLLH